MNFTYEKNLFSKHYFKCLNMFRFLFWHEYGNPLTVANIWHTHISPDKARKGVIYPLKTGIYALVGIPERTFTR